MAEDNHDFLAKQQGFRAVPLVFAELLLQRLHERCDEIVWNSLPFGMVVMFQGMKGVAAGRFLTRAKGPDVVEELASVKHMLSRLLE